MDVTMPDGTVVQGVPDGMSRDDFVAKAKANGMNIPDNWLQTAPAATPPETASQTVQPTQQPSWLHDVRQRATAALENSPSEAGKAGLELLKGFEGGWNDFAKSAATVADMPGGVPWIADQIRGLVRKEPSTVAQDWWRRNTVDPLVENSAYWAANPKADFAQKAANDIGGMLSYIPQAIMTGGEAPAMEATDTAATMIAKTMAHGARAMALPAVNSAVNAGRDVYQKTGDLNAAASVARQQWLSNTLVGMIPMNVEGKVLDRALTGAVGGAAGQAASNIISGQPATTGIGRGAGMGTLLAALVPGAEQHYPHAELSDAELQRVADARRADEAQAQANATQAAQTAQEATKAAQAKETARQAVGGKRDTYLAAQRDVQGLEARAAEEPTPEVYNQLEQARARRADAFNEFDQTAKQAGIVQGQHNGRPETEGSNRNGERQGGPTGNVVPGLDVNGTRANETGQPGQRPLGEGGGALGERVQPVGSNAGSAGEGSNALGERQGVLRQRGQPGVGVGQQGPETGRPANQEGQGAGPLAEQNVENLGPGGEGNAVAGGGRNAEVRPQAGNGPGRERQGTERPNEAEQGGTQGPQNAERGVERRGLEPSEHLPVITAEDIAKFGGPLMPEDERDARLEKASNVSEPEEQPSSPADRKKLKVTLKKTGVSDKQYAANLSSIPRQDGLTPEGRRVEHTLATLVADVPSAERAYAQVPGTEGGRVINTDYARELSPDYNKDAITRAKHSQDTQEPASWLADKLYYRRLQEPVRGNGDVLFTAGGPDSGKSVSLKSDDARAADIVYDGNMNNLPKARRRIRAALDSGRNVKIQLSRRDPIDAFKSSLARALRFGRVVKVEPFAATSNGSFKAALAIAKQYENDKRVQIGAIDTTALKPVSLKEIAKGFYEVTPQQLRQVAAEEFNRGNITEDILRAVGGESAVRMARRGEDHGQVSREPVERPSKETSRAGKLRVRIKGHAEREGGNRAGTPTQETGLGASVPGTLYEGALEGAPETVKPLSVARKAAADYMRESGRPYERPSYTKMSPELRLFLSDTARAYDRMEHEPNDPAVKASYDALIKETLAQWKAVESTGLKVEFIKPGQADPYAKSPRMAIDDVRNNNHLWVFPTEGGFGHGNEFRDNPMTQPTNVVVDGRRLLANDVFRIVHDYFGHIKEGNGFRAEGEYNAWRQHAAMYSDAAQGALASETLGQNAWVNFGPHAAENRGASAAKTIYADQKTGLMPARIWQGRLQRYAVAEPGLEFRHFTTRLNAPEVVLSPEHYGTGLKGAEAPRIAAGAPRIIAAYGRETPPNQIEFGPGATEYTVRVPAREMYDLNKDELGIRAKARTPAGGYDHSKAEQMIRDAGYTGYHLPTNSDERFRGQARFFKPVKATRATLHPDVRARVQQRVKSEWGHDIDFVDNPEDAGAPPGMKVKGVFTPTPDGGKITLVARHNVDETDAMTTAVHEIAGHYGIRGILGGWDSPHYQRVMDQVSSAFPELTAYAARRNSINLNDTNPLMRAINRRSAAEELLAYTQQEVAQTGRRPPAYQRMVGMVRDALRKIGVVRTVTPADFGVILDRAADYARRGGVRAARNRDLVSVEISGHPSVITSITPPWASRRYAVGAETAAQREARETLTPVAAYLTADEKRGLTAASARKVVKLFRELPPVQEFSAAALAGISKRGWYQRSADAIVNTFGPDAPRVAALIAAKSPRVSVDENLRAAMAIWSSWVKAGRPTDRKAIRGILRDAEGSHLPSHTNNVIRALTHPDPEKLNLSGPKVHSFMRNLQGAVHDVTLDTWMAQAAGLDQRIIGGQGKMKAGGLVAKPLAYLSYSARVRQTAEHLSKLTGEHWTPSQTQETIWAWAKTAREEADRMGGLATIPELVKHGEIHDKLVAATPEFSTLLAGPDVEQHLRQLGLGERIDERRVRALSAPEPAAATAEARAAQAALQKPLLNVANRLEAARQADAYSVAESPVDHIDQGLGEHEFRNLAGWMTTHEGDGYLQGGSIQVPAAMRGRGYGISLLRSAVDFAHSRGLDWRSGNTVTPNGQVLYDAMERRGYQVIRHVADKNIATGSLVSRDQVPVFEIKAPERKFAVSPTDDELMKAFVGKIAPRGPGWKETVTEAAKDADHTLKYWLDSLHGLQKAATEAGHKGTSAGYMSATLAKNTGALMKLVLYHGGVTWRENAPAMIPDSVGLVDILRPLGNKTTDFFHAMVARRAARLMAEGREHNFTPDEIAAANKLWDRHPEFEAAYRQLANLKRSVLDFAQAAGTIDPESRKLWENDDHIPFYRVMNPSLEVAKPSAGVMGRVKQQIQRLKGGTAPIGDPMVNMVRNWQSLIQGALSNKAQLLTIDGLRDLGSGSIERIDNVAPNTHLTKEQFAQDLRDSGVEPSLMTEASLNDMYMHQAHIPEDNNTVWVWRDGKKEYYRVHDDFLYRSMTDMNSSGPGTISRVLTSIMRPAAALVRFGVVKNPIFAASIFLRHTMMLYTTGIEGTRGVSPGFRPFIDAWGGIMAQMRNTPEALDLAAAGGTFHEAHGFGDAEDASKALKTALTPKGPAGSVTGALRDFWDYYNRFLAASEGAYRIAVAREVGRRGGSRLEQAYAARRVLNYSHTPGSSLLKFVASVVPFTKAHLAGSHNFIDRLSQDPKGVMMRGALLSLATIAYTYANHNDPRYQQLTDDQRNHYWHFWDVFQLGDHVQFPRPFDLANLFITVPENIMLAALSHEDDRVRQAAAGMAASLWESFNYDYVPSMIRPWLDLRMNERNALTPKIGTPILTQRDQEVAPEAQDAPYVSQTYREIATHMPALAPDWLRSPKQLQYLASSYLGTVGQYAASVSDALLSRGETSAQRGHGEDIVGLRQLYSGGPSYRTKYMDSMYNVSQQIQTAYNTYKQEISAGHPQEAHAAIEQNLPLLRVRTAYDEATKQVATLRLSQREVQTSQMSGAAKSEALDKLQNQMNAIAQRVYRLRPGSKLNPRDASKLIGATTPQAVRVLQQAGLPATSLILRNNSQELAA